MLGWLLLSTCLALLMWYLGFRKPSSHHYPPGPGPLPLLGNLLDVPTKQQGKTYAHWKAVYGDVISVIVLGQRIVILNSLEAAVDLLEKRSAIYADRPRMFMVCELLGWAQQLVFAPYGEHFRNMRKLLHRHLGGRGQLEKMEPYHELIEAASTGFLIRTLRDGSDFHRLHHNVHKTSGAITLRIGYGYDVKDGHDDLVQMMDDALLGFDVAAVPGTFLVDTIPALKWVPAWLPGAAWKRRAREWRKLFVQMTETPYAMAKEQSSHGTGQDNIISLNLQEEMTPQYEYDLKMAVASLYGGGTDTTVAIIMSFILAMTLYPEAQKKAQQEIDDVVGGDRLPLIRDREQLPYVQALISEVLRWNPIVPLGIPHRTTEDDTYRGYFIPQGSTIVVNMWHFYQDPDRYPEPQALRPERFLGPNPQPDIRTFLFGFGRRVCPGLNLAEVSIFASVVRILAVFDIEKVVENGEIVTPDLAFGTGAVSHPLPFKCTIKPRTKQAEALILAECK